VPDLSGGYGMTSSPAPACAVLPRSICSSALHPGTAATPSRLQRVREPARRDARPVSKTLAAFAGGQPVGRFALPKEIAAPAMHLARADGAFTTGTPATIHGGWTVL